MLSERPPPRAAQQAAGPAGRRAASGCATNPSRRFLLPRPRASSCLACIHKTTRRTGARFAPPSPVHFLERVGRSSRLLSYVLCRAAAMRACAPLGLACWLPQPFVPLLFCFSPFGLGCCLLPPGMDPHSQAHSRCFVSQHAVCPRAPASCNGRFLGVQFCPQGWHGKRLGSRHGALAPFKPGDLERCTRVQQQVAAADGWVRSAALSGLDRILLGYPPCPRTDNVTYCT